MLSNDLGDLLPASSHFSDSWFWATRLIGAFSANSDQKFGEYLNNTIFIYNDTIEEQVALWNVVYSSELDIELCRRRTALHEIGHALSLDHTGAGIMLAKDDSLGLNATIEGLLEPENLVFSKNQLAKIQSLEMP